MVKDQWNLINLNASFKHGNRNQSFKRNVNMGSVLQKEDMIIDKISFEHIGKISLKLEDGRIFIIPLKYFPDLKKLPVQKRKKYTIVDDRTILFAHSNQVYHLEDFIGLEEQWRKR